MKWMTQDWTTGELNALVKKLGGESVARAILADELKFELVKPPLPTISVGNDELTPPHDGWKLVEDAVSPVGTVGPLGLAEFLEAGESSVKGEVMLERAAKHGYVLGQRHARALLKVQDQIPEEWRQYYLVFPGTIWRDSIGDRGVPYLYWIGDEWILNFCWLEYVFRHSGRLVVVRKS